MEGISKIKEKEEKMDVISFQFLSGQSKKAGKRSCVYQNIKIEQHTENWKEIRVARNAEA